MRRVLLALFAILSLSGQDLSKLPDWAVPAAEAAKLATPPAEADAWVLLQRWEVVYRGDGEVRVKNYRLVKVLTERGLDEAGYGIGSFGGHASKVKRLKGWNLRPDGLVTKLDSDWTLTLENEEKRVTLASLPRPMKGSLLAFESDYWEKAPTGPVLEEFPVESRPVRAWELAVTAPPPAQASLAFRHCQPWFPEPAAPAGNALKLADLPAWPRSETGAPDGFDCFPTVIVAFQDPELKGPQKVASWDAHAQWTQGQFASRCVPSHIVNEPSLGPLEKLRAIHAWIAREIVYNQVYLSPDRGWVPEAGPEVIRKHYGDCKDYASLLLSEAKGEGFQGFPVLARVYEGRIEPGTPYLPYVFNHVIAAFRLERSLGLPAEIDSPQGRFLIVDPTDRFTPLGYLGSQHLGRRVMVCTDQGAVWLTIPATAIQKPVLKMDLAGAVDAQGALDATVRFEETGDALGLRAAIKRQGARDLAELLKARFFALPPTASMEVLSCGDPMDLTRSFRLEVRIRHPKGFRFVAGEGTLLPLGLPEAPPVLQTGTRARRLPIARDGIGTLEYRVKVDLPWAVTPVLTARTAETAFRTFQFDAKVEPKGAGTTVDLHLVEEAKPAYFGYDALAQGAAAWKKDRSAVLSLREDGFAFKLPGN